MIKELVEFTKNLTDEFKTLGLKAKEGVHILLDLQEENETIYLDTENVQYERYTKKMQETDFIEKCKFLQENAWCIDTNKCFDLPTKAIHSCSPYLVAFKKEHLEGGAKYAKNQERKKKQIYERFGDYFAKALDLFSDEADKERYKVFKAFFSQRDFEKVIQAIENEFQSKRETLAKEIDDLKTKLKETKDKAERDVLNNTIKQKEIAMESVKEMKESEYFLFYLDLSLDKYKDVHQVYLADKLFNTSQYNTEPNEKGDIYGTSNFHNGFNGNMPFLTHQTATFNITGRISDKEAKALYEFEKVLPQKTLPNPLPIFIFKEELQDRNPEKEHIQKRVIGLFRENSYKLNYKEVIEELWDKYSNDFANYYLLFWTNTKDGLVFKDLDYVSKFEYELKDKHGKMWEVEDLFNINFNPKLYNIFEFQNSILQVVFNNNLIVKTKKDAWIYKYFDDLEEKYCKSARNYLIIMNYRKAFYDFIYKSKRQSITNIMFNDMMLISILEDIRLDKIDTKGHTEYSNIRKKLNIWFSLYEKFDSNFNLNNNNNNKTMASKLREYQQFVADMANDEKGTFDLDKASMEEFAFASGQVIYYILKKSKSTDQSYQRLERYLNQANFAGFQQVISTEFARYKHENFSRRFKNVASFVLAYQTNEQVKKYLPQILAGAFANNQLYSDQDKKEANQTNES